MATISDYIRVFPTANSPHVGRLLTEKNIRSILDFIATNDVVLEGFDMKYTSTSSGMNVTLSGGRLLFKGYQIDLASDDPTFQISANVPSTSTTNPTFVVYARIKLSKTSEEFVAYDEFVDYVPEGVTPSTTKSDNIIEVIESSAENLIISCDWLESGEYTYYYLPLYQIAYSSDDVIVLDLRNRTFIRTDQSTIKYLGNDVKNYFGFGDLEEDDEGLETKKNDFRDKYFLSNAGIITNLEKFLSQYTTFIHQAVRGHNSNTLSGGIQGMIPLDTEIGTIDSNGIVDTEALDELVDGWNAISGKTILENSSGEIISSDSGMSESDIPINSQWSDSYYQKVSNTSSPYTYQYIPYGNNIISRLRTFSTDSQEFINDIIIKPIYAEKNQSDIFAPLAVHEYNYGKQLTESGRNNTENPITTKTYPEGWILTTDSNGNLHRDFLYVAQPYDTSSSITGSTGIMTVDLIQNDDLNNDNYSNTNIFEMSNGLLTCNAVRYGFVNINCYNGSDDASPYEISAKTNSDTLEIFVSNLDENCIQNNLQIHAVEQETPGVGSKTSIYIDFANPVDVSRCVYYDETESSHSTQFTATDKDGNQKVYNVYYMNQNLLKTSDVQFRSINITNNTLAETTPLNHVNLIDSTTLLGHNIDRRKLTITGASDGTNFTVCDLDVNGNFTADDINASGNISCSGVINAERVYSAVYNDYAEAFKKNINEEFEFGDVISLDIATGAYTKATQEKSSNCVGVYSDSFGHLIGGEKNKTIEETLEDYLPVAMNGRVKVKVLGPIMPGQLLTVSCIDGVAEAVPEDKKTNYIGKVIGKSLERKDSVKIGKVEMLVMLG